jgi:hypothetical protein
MENKQTPYEHYLEDTLNHVKKATGSKKQYFDFKDAIKAKEFATPRYKKLIEAIDFLNSNPLRENDYYKFLNSYIIHGKKLNEKYFKHDLNKLHEYYTRADKDKKKSNPFNLVNYQSYVIYMFLKLDGVYEAEDNKIFNVKEQDFREYNPLTKIPSVLRGSLPFAVKEYDIKRAFPTFIDIELGTDFRIDIYEKISKSNFAMYLNSNNQTKVTIEQARKGLKPIYNGYTNQIITDVRYNDKGRAFKDFAKYESEYIDKFVTENGLTNYARLHDGVYILKNVNCEKTVFDKVEFTIKECIKPKIENSIISFYTTDPLGNIETSRNQYADFLKQENIIRIDSIDDKIQLLKNTNNVIDFFHYKTNMVSFLESEINEPCNNAVRETIARDNNSLLAQSYHLLDEIELEYYKDNKERFGLPFKNGFYYFDNKKLEIQVKEYSQVKGFFTSHKMQKRNFNYTDEVGNFEIFVQRISTGQKTFDKSNIEQATIVSSFNSMIGYLCHNYKSFTQSPCIILTDEGANDENRNGGRGKTVLSHGLSEVTKTLKKGGNEFVGSYIHNFADLDKSYNLYLIDDIPASFNYNDLYTNITGGINVQPKGSKGKMIEFVDSPKFIITTNWLLRYDENDTSTNRRFIEYKIKPYYGISHTPKDDFNQTFFEDWNELEWNKFYSYIFRCVHSYLTDGLQRIAYDKTEDNYKASFGCDAKESEMARIIDEIINVKKHVSFNVSDFINIYNRYDNPLKGEKFFTAKNTKKLIDIYLKNLKENQFEYRQRDKSWRKE